MSTQRKLDLRAVHFGFASAEKESIQEPQLLLDGYYDASGLTDDALSGTSYLVLGYKGSGKSALGQRLRLLGETDPEMFTKTLLLGEFPFSHFTRIVRSAGPTEQEAHFPSVWTWILLLYFLDSFSTDAGASASPELLTATRLLREHGLLPTGELKLMVLKSAKGGIRGMVPKVAELNRERTFEPQDDEALANVEILLNLCASFSSQSRHLLVIDGLDDILTQKSLQYNVLAALVLAVKGLNERFASSGAPAKVVLLCRTDLFARLPLPNKNKIRQDSAIELDWYHDPREARAAGLMKLANLRAQLVYPAVVDIFDEVFPPTMEGKDVRVFLSNHTRHTPRDFLRLMTHVQGFADPGSIGKETVLKGLRDYSIKYFLPEMHDELVGYVSSATAHAAFAVFGALRRKEFYLSQVETLAGQRTRHGEVDMRLVLEHLFECSAVGNVQDGHYWFKFRNRSATVNFGERLVFHPGLWKALNLPV